MVNTNKILTVSYGTFSCTLEGFDDSFGTMKAIAEYFRDLAADDRYFGAEPPTPDAEMLARIAEREIARRVEARIEDQSIHLRAQPGSVLPVAAGQAKAPEEVAEAPAPVSPARAEKPAKPAPQPEPEVAPEPAYQPEQIAEAHEAEDEDEGGIAGLDDILAAQAAASEAEEADDEDAAEQAQPALVAEYEDDGDEDGLDWPQDDAAAFFDTSSPATTLAETIDEAAAEPMPSPARADAESVAAKLLRIRAVVSQERAAAAETSYSEDEHADEFLADTHDDIEAALALDDAAEIARADAWEDDESDDIAALINRFGGDHHEEAVEDQAPEIEEEIAPDAVEDESIEEIAEEDAEAPEEALFASDAEDELFGEPSGDETAYGDDIAETPVRARVIKMKRADFEAAIAAGDFEEDLEDDQTGTDSSLSPEDEADLLRELAAVEAELDTAEAQAHDEDEDEDAFGEAASDDEDLIGYDEDEDEDEDISFAAFAVDEDDEDDAPIDLAGHASDEDEDFDDEGEDSLFARTDDEDEDHYDRPRTSSPFGANADTDMERMFDMADSQMDEEAGRGRRNAIAHLRAAVAAAKAEGGKIRTHGPDTEVYRDDLDSVVRPRRPEVAKTHTRRPNATRPAPLKLVAEQRVDLDNAESRTPIQPRRASSLVAELGEETGLNSSDFADYAESVGANSLPELLEAAAAYLSFVEGQEQFSRPQLMTQVRQAEHEDFSREDGLRSFGQLLREGKIEKLEGGRFKASESISYRPSKRYAGE